MAEGLARAALQRDYHGFDSGVEVSSAGIAALEGNPPTIEAVMAMESRGVDIRGFRARSVTAEILGSSDLVLAMEERQREWLGPYVKDTGTPVFLLLRLAEAAQRLLGNPGDVRGVIGPIKRLSALLSAARAIESNDVQGPSYRCEVADPIGMPIEEYDAAAASMEGPIERMLQVLLAPGDRSPSGLE